MSEHAPLFKSVVEYKTSVLPCYQGICSCGWKGRVFYLKDEARQEALDHSKRLNKRLLMFDHIVSKSLV